MSIKVADMRVHASCMRLCARSAVCGVSGEAGFALVIARRELAKVNLSGCSAWHPLTSEELGFGRETSILATLTRMYRVGPHACEPQMAHLKRSEHEQAARRRSANEGAATPKRKNGCTRVRCTWQPTDEGAA